MYTPVSQLKNPDMNKCSCFIFPLVYTRTNRVSYGDWGELVCLLLLRRHTSMQAKQNLVQRKTNQRGCFFSFGDLNLVS